MATNLIDPFDSTPEDSEFYKTARKALREDVLGVKQESPRIDPGVSSLPPVAPTQTADGGSVPFYKSFSSTAQPTSEPSNGAQPFYKAFSAPAVEVTPEPAKPADDGSDFTRGIGTELQQTPATFKGALGLVGASAEQVFGKGGVSTALKEWGFDGFKKGMAKASEGAKETDDITVAWGKAKNGDLGALVDWAQYGLGYVTGNLVETVATSVLGGVAGGFVGGPVGVVPGAVGGAVGKEATKGFLKNLVESAVEKEALRLAEKAGAKEAASTFTEQATKNVAKNIGSTGALAAFNFAKTTGGIYGDAEDQARQEGRELDAGDLARVWATGALSSAVETAVDKLGLDAVAGKVKLPGNGRIGRTILGGTVGAGVEGGTELVQTAIERFGSGKELSGEQALNEYINAAALGALGGGAVGGTTGLIKGDEKADDTPAVPSPGPAVASNDQKRPDTTQFTTPPDLLRQQMQDPKFVNYVAAVYENVDEGTQQQLDEFLIRTGSLEDFNDARANENRMNDGRELLAKANTGEAFNETQRFLESVDKLLSQKNPREWKKPQSGAPVTLEDLEREDRAGRTDALFQQSASPNVAESTQAASVAPTPSEQEATQPSASGEAVAPTEPTKAKLTIDEINAKFDEAKANLGDVLRRSVDTKNIVPEERASVGDLLTAVADYMYWLLRVRYRTFEQAMKAATESFGESISSIKSDQLRAAYDQARNRMAKRYDEPDTKNLNNLTDLGRNQVEEKSPKNGFLGAVEVPVNKYPGARKGSPIGDSKDVEMRNGANGAIVELAKLGDKKSSSRTTLEEVGPHDENSTRVVLARNGELAGKPLSQETKDKIDDVATVPGFEEFRVGDMPGVDSAFINYLLEKGHPFRVFHTSDTGNRSASLLQSNRPAERIAPSKPVQQKNPTERYTYTKSKLIANPNKGTALDFSSALEERTYFDAVSKLRQMKVEDPEKKLSPKEREEQAKKWAKKTNSREIADVVGALQDRIEEAIAALPERSRALLEDKLVDNVVSRVMDNLNRRVQSETNLEESEYFKRLKEVEKENEFDTGQRAYKTRPEDKPEMIRGEARELSNAEKRILVEKIKQQYGAQMFRKYIERNGFLKSRELKNLVVGDVKTITTRLKKDVQGGKPIFLDRDVVIDREYIAKNPKVFDDAILSEIRLTLAEQRRVRKEETLRKGRAAITAAITQGRHLKRGKAGVISDVLNGWPRFTSKDGKVVRPKEGIEYPNLTNERELGEIYDEVFAKYGQKEEPVQPKPVESSIADLNLTPEQKKLYNKYDAAVKRLMAGAASTERKKHVDAIKQMRNEIDALDDAHDFLRDNFDLTAAQVLDEIIVANENRLKRPQNAKKADQINSRIEVFKQMQENLELDRPMPATNFRPSQISNRDAVGDVRKEMNKRLERMQSRTTEGTIEMFFQTYGQIREQLLRLKEEASSNFSISKLESEVARLRSYASDPTRNDKDVVAKDLKDTEAKLEEARAQSLPREAIDRLFAGAETSVDWAARIRNMDVVDYDMFVEAQAKTALTRGEEFIEGELPTSPEQDLEALEAAQEDPEIGGVAAALRFIQDMVKDGVTIDDKFNKFVNRAYDEELFTHKDLVDAFRSIGIDPPVEVIRKSSPLKLDPERQAKVDATRNKVIGNSIVAGRLAQLGHLPKSVMERYKLAAYSASEVERVEIEKNAVALNDAIEKLKREMFKMKKDISSLDGIARLEGLLDTFVDQTEISDQFRSETLDDLMAKLRQEAFDQVDGVIRVREREFDQMLSASQFDAMNYEETVQYFEDRAEQQRGAEEGDIGNLILAGDEVQFQNETELSDVEEVDNIDGSENTDTRARRGQVSGVVTAAHVQRIVELIKVKAGFFPEVTVLGNVYQLPEEVLERVIDQHGNNVGAKGLFDAKTGRVYIFSDFAASESDVEFTLFHEIYGHYGIRGVLGDKLNKTLNQLYNTVPQLRKMTDELMKRERIGKLEAVEEALSDLAGMGQPRPLQRFLGKVVELLKPFMPSVADWIQSKLDTRAVPEIAFLLKEAKIYGREGGPPVFSGTPHEIRLADAPPPYEMYAMRGKTMTGYARYNPVMADWYVFTNQGQPVTKGYTTVIVKDMNEVQKMLQGTGGRLEMRTRSAYYIDNNTPNQLTSFEDFQDPSSKPLLKRMWRSLRLRIQNEYLPVFERVKFLQEKYGNVSDFANPWKALLLYEGRAVALLEDFERAYLNRVNAMLERLGAQGADRMLKIGDYERSIHDWFLIARHAPERNAHILKLSKGQNKYGSGIPDSGVITNAQGKKVYGADEILKAIGKEITPEAYATLEALGKLTDQMSRNKVRLMYNKGLISADQAKALQIAYQHYVPMKDAEVDRSQLPNGRKINLRGQDARRSAGRGLGDIPGNTLENALLDFESVIIRGEKNVVANTILSMVEEFPDPSFAVVNLLKYRKKVQKDGTYKEVPLFTDDGAIDVGSIFGVKQVPNYEIVTERDTNYINNPNVLVVKVNGRPVTIEFREEGFGSFLESIHGSMVYNDPVGLNAAAEWFGKYNRFIGQMITSWNPVWVFINGMRDVQTALFNAAADKRISKAQVAEIAKNMPKALKAAMALYMKDTKGWGWVSENLDLKANSEMIGYLEEMRKAGGLTLFMNRNDMESMSKNLRIALEGPSGTLEQIEAKGKALIKFVEGATTPVEVMPRLAAYATLRKAGWSETDAAIFAKELTVNFNMRGQSKALRNLFLFFNPAIQGSAKIMSLAVNDPKKFAAIAVPWIGVGFLMNAIARAFGDDDDDEDPRNQLDKIPNYKRATSIIVAPGVPFGAFPLAYGWNAFYAMGHFAYDSVMGIQPWSRSLGRATTAAVEAFLPQSSGLERSTTLKKVFSIATPTPLAPIVDLLQNENRYGGPIFRDPNKFAKYTEADAYMHFDSVNPLSKGLARWANGAFGGNRYQPGPLDFNPAVMDYLITTMLPGLPAETYKAAGTAARLARGEELARTPIPIVDRFTASAPSGVDVRAFENVAEKVESAYKAATDPSIPAEARRKIVEEMPNLGAMHALTSSTSYQLRELRSALGKIEDSLEISDKEKVAKRNQLKEQERKLYSRYARIAQERGYTEEVLGD